MDHVIRSTLMFQIRKWFILLVRVGIMGMIMLRSVASGDEIGVPDTSLLCISECATCPDICSPPPPKQSYTPPMYTPHSRPPQSYNHSPPPPPLQAPLPPSAPPPEKSETPPSRSYLDTPPPFKYKKMPPAAGQGPPAPGGQLEYPYPYYYFYGSKASFLSCRASIFLVILFYSVVLLFC